MPETSADHRLVVHDLQAGYGSSSVLQGVSFSVGCGEIVSLLGRNGSGRSTTVKAIMGMLPGDASCKGGVAWRGEQLMGLRPFQIARLGLGYVPEGRAVFPGLTVRQNLQLGEQRAGPGPAPPAWKIDELLAAFPALRQREHADAGVLSGGEQQMLSLARTLMGNPSLVMIDEPTEGLAPRLVEQVAMLLRKLKERGTGVLLIEQKLVITLALADRCLVMGRGQIVFSGTPAELQADGACRREWLQV